MNMRKHAYLIIAHIDDLSFRTLLEMIDDERNDIFIHMDVKNKNYNRSSIESFVKKSKVFHVQRTNVSWGGYSLVNAELLLLEMSTTEGNYSYYHLVSGQDLPIKSQNYIHDFFEQNEGREFVHFSSPVIAQGALDRVIYSYPFQEKAGRGTTFKSLIFRKIPLWFQKIFRIKKHLDTTFQFGSQWFSITESLAKYVIERKAWVYDTFKTSLCCDELVLQTLVVNSKFKQNLFHSEMDNSTAMNMRLIDWVRGDPYVFRADDFEEIKKSNMLWARKMDQRTDKSIIEMIRDEFGANHTQNIKL